MSAESEDSGEKPYDPSPRRLEEARRRGEVPKSTEIVTAAVYATLLGVGLAWGGPAMIGLGSLGQGLLERADSAAPLVLAGSQPVAGGLLAAMALALAPFLLLPPLVALAALIAQQALVFAPQKLAPKLSRISPLANARNKFGRSGLFEFAKSTVKLAIISVMLWLFLLARVPRMLAAMQLEPGLAAVELGRLLIEFLALVVAVLAAIGAVDFFWQRHEHLRQHRMSHKEMRDELRQSEGDPHLKQKRRQRGHEIATNRMLADVPKADVVIVNPTHVAVALRWDRGSPAAPVCVAKGMDAVAARIRRAAEDAGVPVHHDPPTARALHATVDLGDEIRPDHYAAVAAAIRFAEAMRMRAAWRSARRPAGPG